jgi:nickel-dependent lactate racemase
MADIRIELPYGRQTIEIEVPSDKLVGTFLPRALAPVSDPAEALRDALANPVSSSRLRDLAAGAKSVAVAIEDATRPVPNALLIDAVMSELQVRQVSPLSRSR